MTWLQSLDRSSHVGPGSTGPVSRRQLLVGAGAALALAACGNDSSTSSPTSAASATPTSTTSAVATTAGAPTTVASTTGRNPLTIPPAVEGPTFDLRVHETSQQFHDGAATATYAYNDATFWGPTLMMDRGSTVTLNVTNDLAEETTVHWHGFHIPAEMDGGPHQMVAPGATWSPSFEVKNNAATYWYHPHPHGATWAQLNQGAGGLIIVRDPVESALALPRTYGVDDIPLVLTSRTFSSTNEFVKTDVTPYGDEMLTNGTLDAEATLPAQLVRFRVLNAEIERAYNLGFSDDRTFHVIGTDGGLVDAPIAVTRLIVTPGERYEFVVDLSADAVGSEVTMQSFNGGQQFGFPGAEDAGSGQVFGSTLNNTTFDVLTIVVAAANATAVTTLPATLTTNTFWTAADATNQRTIAITDTGPGSPFTFDDQGYDMARIDQTVKLDTVEQWTIENGRIFGHSFHIHDVQFKIVSRSAGEISPAEQGWKDTFFIRIGESVSFVARFDDFASTEHPFMYHCHMSNHEDEGLMGQFLVTP